VVADSVEARDLRLVPFDEWFAATCGCGGLGLVPGDTHQSPCLRGIEVLDLRVWALELDC
jgi:hypothetical protein